MKDFVYCLVWFSAAAYFSVICAATIFLVCLVS